MNDDIETVDETINRLQAEVERLRTIINSHDGPGYDYELQKLEMERDAAVRTLDRAGKREANLLDEVERLGEKADFWYRREVERLRAENIEIVPIKTAPVMARENEKLRAALVLIGRTLRGEGLWE